MAYTRPWREVGAEFLKFTNFSAKTSEFADPPLEEVLKKRVVVATLTVAGKLVNMGVPRGHFDVVVVDEAGQALEPETVAPAASLLGTDGQLVLGGDPKQLGPIIHSALAKEYGLAASLLERLMERPLYSKQASRSYDGRVLAKLVRAATRACPLFPTVPTVTDDYCARSALVTGAQLPLASRSARPAKQSLL
eukprot:856209-Prymnesium_polylepis.1